MSEATATSPRGKFVWYEYMGNDLDGAVKFYSHVVGWTTGDPGMAPFPYKVASVAGYAVVADPHGAMFMLFRDAGGNPPPEPPAGTPGLVGWRELHANNGAEALAFYSGQFGWKHHSDFDMGPMGPYHLFESAPGQGGGMMTRMQHTPGPFWLYYFDVDSIDSAIERIKANGGQIANGPMEVPTGQWVVQAIDPQGGYFALVAPKR